MKESRFHRLLSAVAAERKESKYEEDHCRLHNNHHHHIRDGGGGKRRQSSTALPLLQISLSQDSPPFDLERGEADGESFIFPPHEECGEHQEDPPRSPALSDIGHTDSGIESIQPSPRDGVSPVGSSRRPSWTRPALCTQTQGQSDPAKISTSPNTLHPDDARFLRPPVSPLVQRSKTRSAPGTPTEDMAPQLNASTDGTLTPKDSDDEGSSRKELPRPQTLDIGSSRCPSPEGSGTSSLEKKPKLSWMQKNRVREGSGATKPVVSWEEPPSPSPSPRRTPSPSSLLPGGSTSKCSIYDNPKPSTSKLDPKELGFPWKRNSTVDLAGVCGDNNSEESFSGVSCASEYYNKDDSVRDGRSSRMGGRIPSWSSLNVDLQISREPSNLSLRSDGGLRPSPSRPDQAAVIDPNSAEDIWGMMDPYSLAPLPHKLTFTQTLAFPTLAPRELGKHKRTDPHIETERSLNRFAVMITVTVLFMVAVLVVGVLFKFLKAATQVHHEDHN